MKIKKRLFVSFSALSAGALISTQAHAISLSEALASAYENNPTLLAQREGLKVQDELVPQAYAGFLPTVAINYSRGREEQELGIGGEQDNITQSKQFVVSQPIFNGFGSVANTYRAWNLVEAARAQLKLAEQDVLSRAVVAYMDVVRTKQVVELSKNNESVLKEQLGATNDRFKLGEATRTDVAQADARSSRAESDRISAEGNFVAAMAVYERIIREEPKNVSMPGDLPKIPATLDEVVERALENNPALIAAEYAKYASKNEIDLNTASLLPTVSLVGQMRREEGLASVFNGERRTDSVVVNVSVPLFQTGAEYSRVRAAKKASEQKEQELLARRNTTIESATTAWNDVKTTRATISSSKDAVKAAKIALEGVRQEQEVGARTTLDILDAEQELFVAQVNLVTAKRNEVIAMYNLKAVMGELTAEDIGLDVNIFDPTENYDSVKYRVVGY